jgi:hypothetical protein
VKVNILLNGAVVVDVWRHESGKVASLGHDIDGRSAVAAKAHAARVMADRLRQRGDDLGTLDAEIKTALARMDSEPASANEALTELVFAMGERLCPAGADAVDVEIGKAKPRVAN